MPAHLEYIFFNVLVLAGPLLFSFDRKLRFVKRWRSAVIAILSVMPAFIVWDWLVTGRHWWFNPVYTAGTLIGPLPLGEWLFFLTVPFASLFVWEVLRHYHPLGAEPQPIYHPLWLALFALPVVWALQSGKEYTALVLFAFTATAFLDLTMGGKVLARRNTVAYAILLAGLMLLFNGYLTARPVVLYEARYQVDVRIWSIPIEDFLYGYTLLLGCTSVYEKSRGAYE